VFTALYAENTGTIHRSIYLLLSDRKRLPHHLSFPRFPQKTPDPDRAWAWG